MNISRIETHAKESVKKNIPVSVHFKGRSKVTGLFIWSRDFNELKLKNFWRIVDVSRIEEWNETGDVNLARIFNGASFSTITQTKSIKSLHR